jgi:hypothetical protein
VKDDRVSCHAAFAVFAAARQVEVMHAYIPVVHLTHG